ncbi:tetratricopeptide repeat protein [Mesorhizobium sp. CA7]|uniref:tetratricopeptide repeat protein n=1 Tax=Mesorhizobium sp. CA7 TaxID=588501 RepID=UPI001CC95C40|nr:tetratricopeptide repeat protein [Mesorhizobium sp. CA7]MBZ9814753.1 tetratricopeptide repeat protein [Mesorhizobium sp. CA7]
MGKSANRYGTALLELGKREAGTERLQEAAAAYRAALKEGTRDRLPLDWAATQSNLGNALSALGERESGTERLEQAVVAFRAALEEQTRKRAPLDWARTQSNLDATLLTLGWRETGTARLNEAAAASGAAYRAALEERTRERLPLGWAQTQYNLGIALMVLGERESGTALLEEAVATFRATLQEATRERVPLDWAKAQNNLGVALELLSKRDGGTDQLQEAVAACRAALQEWTEERAPLGWAKHGKIWPKRLRIWAGARAGRRRQWSAQHPDHGPVKTPRAGNALETRFRTRNLGTVWPLPVQGDFRDIPQKVIARGADGLR